MINKSEFRTFPPNVFIKIKKYKKKYWLLNINNKKLHNLKNN